MFRQIMRKLSRKPFFLLASVLLIAAVAVGAFAFQTPKETHAAMVCPSQLAYGSYDGWKASSGPVHTLQSALNSQESARLNVDGNYGHLTKAAVYNWQRYHAFPNTPSEWDGIAGPHTLNSLNLCYWRGPRPV
jgi:hypothetical protein